MILFLYGTDSFRSAEALVAIKNKFLDNNDSGANLSVIDFEEDKDAKLARSISSGGLFSKEQLVIAKNILATTDKIVQDEILDFLKKKESIREDKNTTVVFWESGNPRKNNKLFKFLDKNAEVRRFAALSGAKLEQWVATRLKKNNPAATISRNALNKLIAYAGGNLFQLSGEIMKLANFKETGIIEEADVEIMVKAKMNANIFETVEALSGGNKKRALSLLHNQIQEGGDPFYILSMYIYQFRNLLKIGEFFFEGNSDQYRIAKETGLHPFVVQKALGHLRMLTLDKLKMIYKKLQKLDTEIKTGKIEMKMALDKFIVEL